MKFIGKLLITIFALLLVAQYVPGIAVENLYIAAIVAIALGVVNLIVKPILWILTLPINLLTFGLFTFVINALLFWFVASFIDGFSVDGFVPAFIGALVIVAVRYIAETVMAD